ncbi:hypothetical protein G7Y79_00019g046780 [Physcia stellaris]|nr:hypothetical protein G7Y79_00019g046780 [Physcia stellaris]
MQITPIPKPLIHHPPPFTSPPTHINAPLPHPSTSHLLPIILPPKPSTRPLPPLKSLDPDLTVIDRALGLDEEGIGEATPGLGFDLADLPVEALLELFVR